MLLTLIILAIFVIGCLIGWYKGFINTLCNIISFFLAWLIAFMFFSPLSSSLSSDPQINKNLLYFTAGTEKLSDMTVVNVDAATLSAERIKEIIQTSNIPPNIANKLEYNILNQTYSDQNIFTMGEYFNKTVIDVSINLICFLIIFFIIRIICSFLIELADKTFIFPVLKRGDSLIASLFGIMYGFMIITIIFSIIPIVLTVIDIDFLQQQIDNSPFNNFFYSYNIISGVL